MIIIKAIPRLTVDTQIHSLGLGAVVMGVAAAVNLAVSTILMRTAKKTESVALAADAWHLRTDVYTSAGVLAGLVTIRLTGLTIIDPLIALGVTLLIFKAAYDLLKDSIGSILDVRLSDQEEKLIRDVINQYSNQFVEFHNLRTRRAGPERHVDLHLVVPPNHPVSLVHDLCERIEEDLARSFLDIKVLIHTEPCIPEKDQCESCNMRSGQYVAGQELIGCDQSREYRK